MTATQEPTARQQQEHPHVPIPETIVIEGTQETVDVTLATSLDLRCWPRIALCKVCGKGIRLRGLIFDWTLLDESPRRMSDPSV